MLPPFDATRPELPASLTEAIGQLQSQHRVFGEQIDALARLAQLEEPSAMSRVEILHGYIAVFVVAFLITLLTTPLMRRLALANGIIDRPTEARKAHRLPIAYLGGVAVFLGLLGGILYSYIATVMPGWIEHHPIKPEHLAHGVDVPGVPLSILLGMTIIMMVGLLDDVLKISPRIKVAGQLVAAAALAIDEVGVKVAAGVLKPLGALVGQPELAWTFTFPVDLPLLGHSIELDAVYWAGTAVIAVFVLGGCNASNLIDGLDGLLSGVTAIAAAGLLVVALSLALIDDGPRDSQRIILCLALLGACLGFLPHNFNPASIFLGDCGSLLLGFSTVAIILTLGDTGKTFLVLAGLTIYAIPIIDTVLAIVRRRMAGKRMSDPDDQHLHHMLRRSLGVKGAVLTLYAIAGGFATLGVALSLARARVVYALVLVFAAFIVVTAVKIARRRQIEEQAMRYAGWPAAAESLPASAEPDAGDPDGASRRADTPLAAASQAP